MVGKRLEAATVTVAGSNGESLERALAWLLNAGIFKELPLHGNTSWQPVQLVSLALLWICSSKTTLKDAFADAYRWSAKLFDEAALSTYQGFAGALTTSTPKLLPLLWDRIHQLMEKVGGEHFRTGKWLPLAVDGSRGDTPRSKANEAWFCAENFGRGKTAKYRKKKSKGLRRKRNRQSPAYPVKPQVWITMLWHMGLRLPWSWKLGPSNSSERLHLTEILAEQQFPQNTLFCGDAGFVGYDFWKAIIDGGHHFLMRVGGNVRLLKNLGHIRQRQDTVYCWPHQALQRRQQPLVLRLLRFRNGCKFIYLVTTVLDQRSLSARVAEELYRQRWGIEVQFRSLKQTFGRDKLRSHKPERALVEMHWSLLGLSMIQLWAIAEQRRAGLPPERLSVAQAIRVVRQALDALGDQPPPGQSLTAKLRQATLDDYVRSSSKAARYKPKGATKPSAGKPIVSLATRQHKLRLQQHFQKLAA